MPVDFTPDPVDFKPDGVDFRSDAPAQSQKGLVETLWEKAKAYSESKRPKTLKEALLRGIGNAGLGMPSVGEIPFLPNQSVAGVAKGVTDLALGPTQVASHLTGIGTSGIDRAVNNTRDFFRDNFDKATAGEITGQALSALVPVPGGGFGRAAQYALTPALSTPETDLNNNFVQRKLVKGAVGLAAGGTSELASKLLQRAKPALSTIARAEKPEEIVSDMRTAYSGSPAQALRESTNANMASDISKARQVYAPGDELGKEVSVDMSAAADALESALNSYKKSGRVEHPEQVKLMQDYLNKWREIKTTTWEDAAGILSDLKADLHLMADGRRVDKKPFDNAAEALIDSMTNASPEAMRHQMAGDKSWVDNVVKHFSPTAKAMRQAPDEAHALSVLSELRPGPTKRMDSGRVTELAQAGDIKPIVDDWVSTALERSGGNPKVFQTHLKSGIEALRLNDPALAARVEDALKVAGYASPMGMIANIGASKIPGAGVAGTVGASFSPAYAGPGMSWRFLQSGTAKGAAGAMAQAPVGQEANAFQSLLWSKLPWVNQ